MALNLKKNRYHINSASELQSKIEIVKCVLQFRYYKNNSKLTYLSAEQIIIPDYSKPNWEKKNIFWRIVIELQKININSKFKYKIVYYNTKFSKQRSDGHEIYLLRTTKLSLETKIFDTFIEWVLVKNKKNCLYIYIKNNFMIIFYNVQTWQIMSTSI